MNSPRPIRRSATPAAYHFLRMLLTVATLSVVPAQAVPPRYDHIVIVVEENRTVGQIIGDLVRSMRKKW